MKLEWTNAQTHIEIKLWKNCRIKGRMSKYMNRKRNREDERKSIRCESAGIINSALTSQVKIDFRKTFFFFKFRKQSLTQHRPNRNQSI